MKIGKLDLSPLDLLLVFVPVAVVLELLHVPAVWMFVVSAVAIIPLAGLMGRSTEHLAERVGPGVGGLLNASFGNAAELIIAGIALHKGLFAVVKASLTGSIIGNILLVLGLAVFTGGLRHKVQTFNRTAAGQGAVALALAAIALLVPTMFDWTVRAEVGAAELHKLELNLSLPIAVILIIVYGLGLIFSLRTHSHLYGAHEADEQAIHTQTWSTRRSVITLIVATLGVGVVAEFMVGAVEETAKVWGMSEVFVGVILVAIVGNAAEHSTAVLVAFKNKTIDLAVNIAIGSGIQIALFVAPVLVFLSYAFPGPPMDLVFTPFEVLSVTVSVTVVSLISLDGESNWMEGVQLLAVYAILGLAFYFLPH